MLIPLVTLVLVLPGFREVRIANAKVDRLVAAWSRPERP
jgi:hypothetical protein